MISVEVFHSFDYPCEDENGTPLEDGFYYWYCFPGCLPDSEPIGPFETAELAEQDAIEDNWDSEIEFI